MENLQSSYLSEPDKQFLEDRNKRLGRSREDIVKDSMANVPNVAIGDGPSLDGNMAAQALRARSHQRLGAKTNDLQQISDYESYGKRMKNLGIAQSEANQEAQQLNKKWDVIRDIQSTSQTLNLEERLIKFQEIADLEYDRLFKQNLKINEYIYAENKRRKAIEERNKIINGIIKGTATVGGAIAGGIITGGNPAGIVAGGTIGSGIGTAAGAPFTS